MKKFKEILLETNVSAGIGIRGFGDVTGNPATTNDSENSHIDRVTQGAEEYTQQVKNFINTHNNTSILDEPESDNWWAKAGAKGASLTAMGKPFKTVSKMLKEAQDNEPDDVAKARQDYAHHTEQIHKLGKQMGDVRNKELQDKIDQHQKSANEAQKVFRTFDKQQSKNKVAAEKAAGKQFDEEMGVGSGAIAGAGVDAPGKPGSGEPGVPPKNKYKKKNETESPVMGDILRRPMLAKLSENTGKFAGHITHKVPHSVFNKITQEKAKGKHWKKYLDEGEHTQHIKQFANNNPKKPIIIEDEQTGYMCFARYGK